MLSWPVQLAAKLSPKHKRGSTNSQWASQKATRRWLLLTAFFLALPTQSQLFIIFCIASTSYGTRLSPNGTQLLPNRLIYIYRVYDVNIYIPYKSFLWKDLVFPMSIFCWYSCFFSLRFPCVITCPELTTAVAKELICCATPRDNECQKLPWNPWFNDGEDRLDALGTCWGFVFFRPFTLWIVWWYHIDIFLCDIWFIYYIYIYISMIVYIIFTKISYSCTTLYLFLDSDPGVKYRQVVFSRSLWLPDR